MTIVGVEIDKAAVSAALAIAIDAVTPDQMAKAALDNQSAEAFEAIKYGNGFKEEYGSGIATIVLIYNATGYPLTFQSSHDWSGHIGKYPYDDRIGNGQWSAVLHVHTGGSACGSEAVVGYRVLDGETSNPWTVVAAWDTPYSGTNGAWGTVMPYSQYSPEPWSQFESSLESGQSGSGASSAKDKYKVSWSVGQSSSPILTIVVTRHPDAVSTTSPSAPPPSSPTLPWVGPDGQPLSGESAS